MSEQESALLRKILTEGYAVWMPYEEERYILVIDDTYFNFTDEQIALIESIWDEHEHANT